MTPTKTLFQSYGAWRVAKDAALQVAIEKTGATSKLHEHICNGMSRDPAFVNWCAEISACWKSASASK